MNGIDKKISAVKSIKKGIGVQAALDKTYEILGNPLLIFDMQYRLIARPLTAECDDPIWMEFINNGGLCPETIEFFKSESFIDMVASASNYDGVTYLTSSMLPYNRIFGQLYDKNHMPIADLVAVGSNMPFEDDSERLIKAICQCISKELIRNDYYNGYSQSYQEGIIAKLINGDVKDREIYSAHVANIDINLKTKIFMAIAELSGAVDFEFAELWRGRLEQVQPSFRYYVYGNKIIILLSVGANIPLDKVKRFTKLKKFAKANGIHIAASDAFENLFELEKHYKCALSRLENSTDKA